LREDPGEINSSGKIAGKKKVPEIIPIFTKRIVVEQAQKGKKGQIRLEFEGKGGGPKNHYRSRCEKYISLKENGFSLFA